MTLLDGDSLADIFELPIDAILNLPDLILADLELGDPFLDDLFAARPITRRPIIHIPGIDDIIHLVPESFLPQDEQDRRRRERAIRLQDSPTPESVQAIGTILTFVDDVQDALLTASVIARIAAVPFPQVRPVAIGLGVAAEALNIFQLASLLGIPGLEGKRRVATSKEFFNRGLISRARTARTLARALPTVGEAVQILQTTDQLFGVGLNLGPIVGLFTDLIFGLPQGAEFAFQSGIRYRPGDELFLREEDQRAAETLRLHPTLGRIVRGAAPAAWILALPDGPSFSDRIDSLVLLNLIYELARGFIPESRWEPIILAVIDNPIPSTRRIRPNTAVLIRQLGMDPEQTETFPIQGNPKTLSPRQQGEELRRMGETAIDKWIQEAPDIDTRIFANRLTNDLGFRAIRAFEGPGVGFVTHGSPEWRALVDSLELGLVAPPGATQEQSKEYLEKAAAFYRDDPDRPIPQRDLLQLHGSSFPT